VCSDAQKTRARFKGVKGIYMPSDIDIEKIKASLGQKIVKGIIEQMYLDGEISLQDLHDPHKVSEILHSMDPMSDAIAISTDHRNSLLDRALTFKKEGKADLAFVFFGTYFEHSINRVIAKTLSQKKFTVKTKNEVIRSLNISAKFSWFLEIMGHPKFNSKHFKTVLKVAEARNAFIHYKFNYEDIEIDKREGNSQLLEAAHKAATYTKSYVSKNIYNGKKVAVKKQLDALFKNP